MGGMGGMSQLPPNFRPGDWICGKCNKHNYASKVSCISCNTAKALADSGIGSELSYGGGGGGMFPPNFKPGDWMCNKCNKHNYGSKTECFGCGIPRQEGDSSGGSATGSSGLPYNFRPGDWMCKCGQHNYASKMACHKCGGDKSTHSA
jgi:hypothetical protein